LFWNCSVLYLCCFETVRCYICVVLKLFGVIFVLFWNCSVLYLCCFETVRCYICLVLKLFGVIFVLFFSFYLHMLYCLMDNIILLLRNMSDRWGTMSIGEASDVLNAQIMSWMRPRWVHYVYKMAYPLCL
jgi:hypothetical protein